MIVIILVLVLLLGLGVGLYFILKPDDQQKASDAAAAAQKVFEDAEIARLSVLPSDGKWSEYNWGVCSVECGSGTKTGSSTYTPAKYGGNEIDYEIGGSLTKTKSLPCNTQACSMQKTSYVLLELKNTSKATLNIAEIQVFDINDNNVAKYKSITFSSKYKDYHPKNIINNVMIDFGHSSDSSHEWFQINLLGDFHVKSIKIINRSGYVDRIIGATVKLRDSDHKVWWTSPPILQGKDEYIMSIPQLKVLPLNGINIENDLDCKMHGSIWINNKCNIQQPMLYQYPTETVIDPRLVISLDKSYNIEDDYGLKLTYLDPRHKFNEIKLRNYDPIVPVGDVVFDMNGTMCMMTRSDNENGIYWSYYENTQWNTFDLGEIIRQKQNISLGGWYNSSNHGFGRPVFDSNNDVWFMVSNNLIIHMNYKTKKILSHQWLPIKDYIIQQRLVHNYPLYNNRPIMIKSEGKNLNIGWFDQEFKNSQSNFVDQLPSDTSFLVLTVQHSGRVSPMVTINNISYIVFATMHGNVSTTNEFDYNGPNGIKVTPTWIVSFNHGTEVWSIPKRLGDTGTENDDHNGPAININSNGIIYVLAGNHGDPINIYKSVKPFDITEMIGPKKLNPSDGNNSYTYPGLVIDNKDIIYIISRGPEFQLSVYQLSSSEADLLSIARYTPDATGYAAWRDHMVVDPKGNLFIYLTQVIRDSRYSIKVLLCKPVNKSRFYIVNFKKNA